MRRDHGRPFGASSRPSRMVSLVIAIAVLFPWRVWLELEVDAFADVAPEPVVPEEIVPGLNDLDEEEVARTAEMLELATDKVPLKPEEMHAYWRLMTWCRTESFRSLMGRAKQDVPFTQFWEQPDKYRGKLVTLRLHVSRVLKYDAPDNPQELKVCYEAWGWTDESKSFPYVIVFPECPPNLPIGPNAKGEVVFVGYFLKIMGADVARGAPLLIGRVQSATRAAPKVEPRDPWTFFWIVLGGIIIIAAFMWLQFRSSRIKRRRRPIGLPETDNIEISPSRTSLDLAPAMVLTDDEAVG